MPKRATQVKETTEVYRTGRPSALLDTRVVYCGDCLEQLRKLPDVCVDLIYLDPPFNSNRNYEVFWGETKEKRAFADRHESTQAYIDYMRPRCVELSRVLKKIGSFYYHCDWHAYLESTPLLLHDAGYREKHFKYTDEKHGRVFQPISLTGSGIRNGESGQPWRGVNPTNVNRHWAIPGRGAYFD